LSLLWNGRYNVKFMLNLCFRNTSLVKYSHAIRAQRTLRFFNACVNCGALTESATEQNRYLGFGNPNRRLVDFFFWLFRKGWSTVIILSVVSFYLFVLFFTALIVWAANLDNDCVRVGGKRFGELSNRSVSFISFDAAIYYGMRCAL